MNNNPCRKPDGPYLIEAAPHYRQYLASKTAREIVQRIIFPLSICSAAVAGYRSELHQMFDADSIYLGSGK